MTEIFDEEYEELDFVQEHEKIPVRLIDANKAIEEYAHYGISHSYDVTDLEDILKECPTVQGAEKYEQFAEWVAKTIFDENLEMSFDAFAEVACRKLEKLGIVKENGNMWELIKGA